MKWKPYAKVKNEWSYTSIPLYDFMECKKATFPLPCTSSTKPHPRNSQLN